MGTFEKQLSAIMKFLIALSALMALASATSEATCEDCQAVVMTISAYLTAEESVSNQVEILLAEVCPRTEDPETCVEKLPAFWGQVANVMWPLYYNEDAGGAPTRGMTCDECLSGIRASIDQLLSEEL